MCGIVGMIGRGGGGDERAGQREVLARMCEAIRHRGPDEEGAYLKGGVAMGMRRLAIIDLAGGQQPIRNERGTAWIVFNGEIYNYRELRADLEKLGHKFYTDCDTEAIIHAYDRYGADCPRYLRGMFAFAIWDEEKSELLLARDRVGKKPLLYTVADGQLIFASEFSALFAHPSVSREINREAIHYYLSFMCVPAPLTAYRHIKKLEPGHTLRFTKDGEIITERYWQLDFDNKLQVDEKEAGERVVELLREAVRVRLMSEVPLGAFLSGGIDSSTVVALMSEESSAPVKTFSIGFEEQDFSELAHARRVAAHVGAEHHEFVVRPNALEVLPTLVEHYGEPYADSSAIPTYYVSRETRRHVTVALNGDGGDECFAGYQRYAAMELAAKYHKVPAMLRESLINPALRRWIPAGNNSRAGRVGRARRFLQAAAMPAVERYLRWVSTFDRQLKDEMYTDDYRAQMSAYDPARFLTPWFAHLNNGHGAIDASLLADTMTYLPNDLLVKVDIASMAVSLEARSPFLDHHVMEYAARLPENLKVRGLTTKYLLKRVLGRLLPEDILQRPKMGFGVPIGHWFRGEMKDFLRSILLSEKSLGRGIFRPEMIGRLVAEHTEGRRDYAHQLWTLLMLELWFERFID